MNNRIVLGALGAVAVVVGLVKQAKGAGGPDYEPPDDIPPDDIPDDIPPDDIPPSATFSGHFTWPENIYYRQAHVQFSVSGNVSPFKVLIFSLTNDAVKSHWVFIGPISAEVVYDSRLNAEMWAHPDRNAPVPNDIDMFDDQVLQAAGWKFVAWQNGTD